MKKRRELRSLWNSNASWTNSGYAVEQRDLLTRLAKDGWPVAQSAFWGLEGYPIESPKGHEGIKFYPKMGDSWGTDAMFHHGRDFKANVVFSMQDVWTLNPEYLSKINVWIPWVPIDKDPVPPGVLNNLKYAYKILTFSKYGQKQLEKQGFASTLILEGTDTNIFKPMDQALCRKEVGLPQDAFVFGMVAANKENPPRKGFQEALQAFKLFHDRHPEAVMMFHSQQQAPGGFPIPGFAEYLGIREKCFFVNDYVAVYGSDSSVIAKEMNAFDVLMHPSHTEGFGLTVVEANACGKPALVNNCTSMPEITIDGVTGGVAETGTPRWTSDNAWVYPADVKSLYEKMEMVYKMVKENPEKTARDCRANAVDNYNIDTIVKEQWIPLFEELQETLIPKPQSLQASMVGVK